MSASEIYLIVLKWPVDNVLNSACLDQLDIESIFMLDTQSELKVIFVNIKFLLYSI